jgi:hypothetical protein
MESTHDVPMGDLTQEMVRELVRESICDLAQQPGPFRDVLREMVRELVRESICDLAQQPGSFRDVLREMVRESLNGLAVEQDHELISVKDSYEPHIPTWLMGIVDYHSLPILDTGEWAMSDYAGRINFIRNKWMTSAIMRGVDKHKRPFVVFRVIDRDIGQISTHVIYQRYVTDGIPTYIRYHGENSAAYDTQWSYDSRYEEIILHTTAVNESVIEYLTRLFQHQPCGKIYESGEGLRVNEAGTSIIELY